MNILFLVGRWGVGGVERVTRVLADGFAALGWGVSIVAHHVDDRALLAGMPPSVKAFELPPSGRVAALRKILLDEKVDAVINQWCNPYKVTRLINEARKGLHVKLVAVHHNPPDKNRRIMRAPNPLIQRIAYWVTALNARLVYEMSDEVVMLSSGFVKPFGSFIGRKASPKVFAIPNPLTLPVPTSVDFGAKDKTILYVGRLEETQKCVSRIIDAWRVLASLSPEWNLEIVGDGPDRAHYELLAKDLPRIHFAGAQDPTCYYERASALVLTSDYEGFGLVIVEAMAYGVVPIVYGSYVSVFDIIDNGVNGLITPAPYSREATVAALRKLMDDPALLATLSQAAVVKSRQFSLDSVLKQWEALLCK